MNNLKEGYILDRATLKEVDFRKPEELVRQNIEKELHDNYRYDYMQMDIEVSIQRGEVNNKKNDERADIVVYKTIDKSKRSQSADILGIIETKRHSKRDGILQLKSYMTATSCHWGIWTNGEDRKYLYRDFKTGEIKDDYIFNIPCKNETFEDIGRLQKKDLVPIKTLKPIFNRILYYLFPNTDNISRVEKLGNELIKLIFCKLYDETYDLDELPKFRIGFEESPEQVKKRIISLWDSVKDDLLEDGIFETHEKIELDAKSLLYVVGELERFSLRKTDKDVIGDAFEVFAERQFAGQKGQFFTPREVVKMAVKIIDPQPKEKILDPACGSGGFLIYALEHIWDIMGNSSKYNGDNLENLKKEFARKYFYGIDKENDLVKICKAYMSIIGDGRSNICQADTLKNPQTWQQLTKNIFLDDNNRLKKVNVILTNPPFGSKIKINHKEVLENYELGHKWTKNKNGEWIKTNKTQDTEPQILFIEFCLNILEDGGRLAIVLPDGIFGNPTDSYIREWIKERAEILAVIDCPHNTFMPHTHTKTSVLILRKWKNKNRCSNYPIFFSIVDKCGHGNRGEDIYTNNEFGEEIKDEEFSNVINIWNNNPNRIIKDKKYNKLGFTLYESEIKDEILIPRYYNPKTEEDIVKYCNENNCEIKTIQSLYDDKIISIRGAGQTASSQECTIYDEIPFLRTSDLGCWETRNFSVQNVSYETFLKFKKKQDLRVGDILFVKDGTYRIGETIILTEHDLKMLVQGHFYIIRSLNHNVFDPYLLMYLFHLPIVKKQINEKTFIQATLSTIGNRLYEIKLPIPKNEKEKNKISLEIKNKIFERSELKNQIQNLFYEY